MLICVDLFFICTHQHKMWHFLMVKEKEKLVHTGFYFSQQGEKHLTVNYPSSLLTQNRRKANLWLQCHLGTIPFGYSCYKKTRKMCLGF